jgi:hypothetical protein
MSSLAILNFTIIRKRTTSTEKLIWAFSGTGCFGETKWHVYSGQERIYSLVFNSNRTTCLSRIQVINRSRFEIVWIYGLHNDRKKGVLRLSNEHEKNKQTPPIVLKKNQE